VIFREALGVALTMLCQSVNVNFEFVHWFEVGAKQEVHARM
jgi:hypothetical protein